MTYVDENATHVCIQWETQEILRKVCRNLQGIAHSSPLQCCAKEEHANNV